MTASCSAAPRVARTSVWVAVTAPAIPVMLAAIAVDPLAASVMLRLI